MINPPKLCSACMAIIPYMFDCWFNPFVHLLILKSSMAWLLKSNWFHWIKIDDDDDDWRSIHLHGHATTTEQQTQQQQRTHNSIKRISGTVCLLLMLKIYSGHDFLKFNNTECNKTTEFYWKRSRVVFLLVKLKYFGLFRVVDGRINVVKHTRQERSIADWKFCSSAWQTHRVLSSRVNLVP